MQYLKVFTTAVLLVISMASHAADRSAEIAEYIALYQGHDLLAQKKATESLAWKGITDERVYDEIERLLINLDNTVLKPARHKDSRTGRNALYMIDNTESDAIAWFIKALGYSGNPKYLATIKKIESESVPYKHQKYINETVTLLPQYIEWNKTINDETQWNDQESGSVNRYANMIRSNSLKLKEMAAKRIYNETVSNKYLLDVVEKELLAHYTDDDNTRNFAQTYGFMSKSLGANGGGAYINTIRMVAEGSHNTGLKRYAQGHLFEYQ